MTDDIVSRLRFAALDTEEVLNLRDEAAIEIERLRAALSSYHQNASRFYQRVMEHLCDGDFDMDQGLAEAEAEYRVIAQSAVEGEMVRG